MYHATKVAIIFRLGASTAYTYSKIRIVTPGDGAVNPNTLTLSKGLMTAYAPNVEPGETKKTTLVVTAGDLMRVIHVYFRKPYMFEPITLDNKKETVILDAEQGSATTLRFSIPDDFPEELFPLPVRIYTQKLYSKSPKVEIKVEPGGKIYYLYNLRERGVHEIEFNMNNAFSAETITVSSDYSEPGTAAFHPDFFTINGRMTYAKKSWLGVVSYHDIPKGANVEMRENGNPIPPETSIVIPETGWYRLRIPYTTNDKFRIRFAYGDGYQTKDISQFRDDNSWLRLSP